MVIKTLVASSSKLFSTSSETTLLMDVQVFEANSIKNFGWTFNLILLLKGDPHYKVELTFLSKLCHVSSTRGAYSSQHHSIRFFLRRYLCIGNTDFSTALYTIKLHHISPLVIANTYYKCAASPHSSIFLLFFCKKHHSNRI